MKRKIHPPYRPVLFVDPNGAEFLIPCAMVLPNKITKRDGVPVVNVPVTSASHPAWREGGGFVDSEGNIAKFNRRYEARRKKTLI